LLDIKFKEMDKKIISTAAVLGMIAIILGAFGAHGLKNVLSIEQLNTFETGVKYQMYHALFLLFIGTTTLINQKIKKTILNLTIIGVVFFSGSIYLLATNSLTSIDFKVIGFITPIGGLFLIISWFLLFFDLIKPIKKKNKI
jgi:uncharacterized membrane protein YgdD (TMEM256/DUF423 family)